MENEQKKEAGHDIAIALIQKDIGYIKDSMTRLETTLAVFDRNFARKDETDGIKKALENFDKDIAKKLETLDKDFKETMKNKVDRNDFEPMKDTLRKINWLLISAVIVGLLAIIIT